MKTTDRYMPTPATCTALDEAQNGCGDLAEILARATRDYSFGVPWEALEDHVSACSACRISRVGQAL